MNRSSRPVPVGRVPAAGPNSPAAARPPLRVGMVSLGCAKNLVDAEIMLGTLLKDGVEVINDPTQADAVIVNTCSFIDAAQEESVDSILESAAVRDARQPHQALIVAGCLSQRFRDELPRLFPEVDAFMGIDQVARVGTVVREALARRAERLGEGRRAEDEGRRAKGEITQQLAELGQARPESSDRAEAWVEVDARPTYIPDYATPRFRLTPRHFAYVKIAEGCNHPCSFCIIPRMRGRHRSRPLDDIVEEARQLVASGVKELNLISQDSTYYGLDRRPNPQGGLTSPARFAAATAALPAEVPTLSRLLRELNALPGDFWIRLLYTHPAHWTDELIATMAACPKVARYVDLPLQHIHDVMLQRMRRETSRAHIESLLGRLRAGIPGLTLRTTFIVGFPGETEAMFEDLLAFIRATRFERLGVFPYSREDGTVAGRMAGQVSGRIRQRRRERAMAVQREVAESIGAAWVGRELRVLVEGEASRGTMASAQVVNWEHGFLRAGEPETLPMRREPWSVARGEADAPDIDGRVYVRGRRAEGNFARVRVVGHTAYDLLAEPVAGVAVAVGRGRGSVGQHGRDRAK